jgi:hypothetical protein
VFNFGRSSAKIHSTEYSLGFDRSGGHTFTRTVARHSNFSKGSIHTGKRRARSGGRILDTVLLRH